MKILAFDTSSSTCSIALLNTDNTHQPIQSVHKTAPMQQGRLILPLIQSLLNTANLTLSDLNAIAYGRGPGSFTGVRLAASVAQGLGYALHLPLIPVSSLAVLAQTAFLTQGLQRLLVAVDARMGEVYWAKYQVKAGLVELIGQEEVVMPNVVSQPLNNDWHSIGDGWKTYETQLITRIGFTPPTLDFEQFPSAEALLALAKTKYEQGDVISASQALPVYLR